MWKAVALALMRCCCCAVHAHTHEQSDPGPALPRTPGQIRDLESELLGFRVTEPTIVGDVLYFLRLGTAGYWRADLAALSISEQRELMDTLQESGVALGDRSRIRRYMLSPVEHILAAEEIFGEIFADRCEPPRRLQQSGGTQVNFESLAIALTGLLGLAGQSLTFLLFF